jgi:hypothetical protein
MGRPDAEVLPEELSDFASASEWILPGERKPDQPMDRHLFDKWLHVAERKAELPRLAGSLYPCRRKWATEETITRSRTSLRQAAGRIWRHAHRYKHPDGGTLLAVISEPRKVRDTACPRVAIAI